MITVDMNTFVTQHIPPSVAIKELVKTGVYSEKLEHIYRPTEKFHQWTVEHGISYKMYLTLEQVYIIEFDNLSDFTFYKLSW